MPPRRRFAGRSFVRTQKRVPSWFFVDIGPTTIGADASSLIGSLNATALLARPFTIVRTHLMFHVESDQSVASESPVGALGMMIVSDEAIAAGSSAIPDPVADSDAPWYVWQPFQVQFELGDATGFTTNGGRQYMIDSKAMRKVGNNEDIAFVLEEIDTFGVIIRLLGRFLIKLH